MKVFVVLWMSSLLRMPARVMGEKQSSISCRFSPAREKRSGGSPVLNSSMVESTISYFCSRVALSGNWSSARRCSRSGREEEWR